MDSDSKSVKDKENPANLKNSRRGFVDDIIVEGTYFAATIRSPISKGRLKNIETPELPQFYTLVKAEDIPGENRLHNFSMPILVSDTISYIGEPVALILGPDEIKVREYADKCRVIAEEIPPFFFPNNTNYENIPKENILRERNIEISIGEKHNEENESKEISSVKGFYKTGSQEHWYTDPHGALALFLENRMIVYTASQWIFHIKKSISQVLKLSYEEVLIEPCKLGMHLDGKTFYPSLIACQAALCSFIIKKPVKLMLTREEDFRYSPKRNAAAIEFESNVNNTNVIETKIKASIDIGAEDIFTDEILDRTSIACLGVYDLGNVTLGGNVIKTNIPPQGPLSGFGLSQGFFALERHVSKIADALHQDPAEWRKNHALKENSNIAIGAVLKKNPLEEIIDSVCKTSAYYRKWASYELLRQNRRLSDWRTEKPIRGIGIATAYQGNGFLYNEDDQEDFSIELTLDKDSFLEIKVALFSSSSNLYSKIWKKIAVEILSIKEEKIKINFGNTDIVLDSGIEGSSRNIVILNDLVRQACQEMQKEMKKESPPITIHQSYKPNLRKLWGGSTEKLFDENSLTNLSWGAAVVELEIDPIECTPIIRGIWLVIDGGKILSEKYARLSLTQSVIHALGWTLWEDVYYVNGKIPDSLFYNYAIQAPYENPRIQIDFINQTENIYKGIGELPFSIIPASYLQAISQAMDYHFEKIPLNNQDLWEKRKLKETST